MDDITHFVAVSLCAVFFCACVFVGGFVAGKRHYAGDYTTVHDTTYIYRSSGASKPAPAAQITAGYIAVPRVCFLTDTAYVETVQTVHEVDTVYLPRQEKYYSELEGRLRMWVSGYEPSLDRWELDEQQIETVKTLRRYHWSVSVAGGYGVGKAGLSPFVGLTVGYNLLSI